MPNRLLVIVLLSLLLPASSHAAAEYRVRDLSSEVGQHVRVNAINSAGFLAGTNDTEAFTWSPNTGYTRLTLPDGTASCGVNALNSAGTAVGWVQGTGGHSAVAWNPDGNCRPLDSPAGANSVVAKSINESGHIAGVAIFEEAQPSGTARYRYDLAVWEPDGSVQDLGELPYGSNVDAILDDGRIYGRTQGFVFWIRGNDGVIIQSQPASAAYADFSRINSAGLVAGSVQNTEGGPYQACIWNPDGTLNRSLLPLSPEDDLCSAYDINSAGFAVGESSVKDFTSIRACLWTPDGTPIALPTLDGTVYSRGKMISDNGWIVGECGMNVGYRTVLWTPVPEPTSLAGMLMGVGVLADFVFRRQQLV